MNDNYKPTYVDHNKATAESSGTFGTGRKSKNTKENRLAERKRRTRIEYGICLKAEDEGDVKFIINLLFKLNFLTIHLHIIVSCTMYYFEFVKYCNFFLISNLYVCLVSSRIGQRVIITCPIYKLSL